MKPLLLGLALAAFVAIPPTLAAPPEGYVKVWGDEFDEPNLDAGKWYTRYVYNGGTLDHLNDEQERYRDAGTHVMTGHSVNLRLCPKAPMVSIQAACSGRGRRSTSTPASISRPD